MTGIDRIQAAALQWLTLRQIISVLGNSVAIIILFGFTTLFATLAVDSSYNMLQLRAKDTASRVAKHIYATGELWKFHSTRLADVIALNGDDNGVYRQSVYQSASSVAVVVEDVTIAWPSLSADQPVVVEGAPVGFIRIETSGQPLLWRGLWIVLVGSLLGLVGRACFATVPLHALDRTMTELEREQGVLKEISGRFETALDSMVQGLVLFDPKGRAKVVNRRLKLMADESGLSPKALSSFNEFAEQLGIFEILPQSKEDGGPTSRANEVPTTFEKQFPSGCIYRMAVRHLADTSVLVMIEDITQQHRAEMSRVHAETEAKLMREREKAAEEASKAKSSFLAVMSHEIRTPMNAVLGLTSALLETELTPEQARLLKTIHESGDSLLEILNDILDYSKLEAGKLTFEAIPFATIDIGQAAIDIIAPRAVAKGLSLTKQNDAGLPASLLGDAGRLRQVLINLVSNAVKFTATGHVTVSCRCLSRTQSHAEIEWTVSDTGIGIAADQVSGLFRDFVQADSTINRRFGGSGLGLSICKRIIDAMRGKIEVESTLGLGTTIRVSVTLPSTDDIAAKETPDYASREQIRQYIVSLARPLRLLIADDNSINRLVAAKMLEGLDIRLSMAADGAEAVVCAKNYDLDLILMDVRMPEMDGIEASRVIRGNGCSVPIIAFTANAFAADVEETRRAGMSGFVAKPVRKPLLLAAIAQCLPNAPLANTSEENGATSTLPTGLNDNVRLPHPASPVFEPSEFRLLAQELGAELMNEAVDSFKDEMRVRLDRLATLDLSTDRETISREAHTIKGTAATFGLLRCSEIARWLESNASNVAEPEYEQVMQMLRLAYDDAQSAVGLAVAA